MNYCDFRRAYGLEHTVRSSSGAGGARGRATRGVDVGIYRTESGDRESRGPGGAKSAAAWRRWAAQRRHFALARGAANVG